jgi:hypothetical protein
VGVNSHVKKRAIGEKLDPGIRTYPTRFYKARFFLATRNRDDHSSRPSISRFSSEKSLLKNAHKETDSIYAIGSSYD